MSDAGLSVRTRRATYTAIDEERTRAHRKHAASGQSMEQVDVDHPLRFPILVEEVGEVAKALNEGATREELRAELIQVAAMAAAWAEAITREAASDASEDPVPSEPPKTDYCGVLFPVPSGEPNDAFYCNLPKGHEGRHERWNGIRPPGSAPPAVRRTDVRR